MFGKHCLPHIVEIAHDQSFTFHGVNNDFEVEIALRSSGWNTK